MPVSSLVPSPAARSIRALRTRVALCCAVLATAGLAACGQSLPTAPDAQQTPGRAGVVPTSPGQRGMLRDASAPPDSARGDSTNNNGDKGFWW